MSKNLAFDTSSSRQVDENGYLHVSASHITKATVNPYYGYEIPGNEELGLDPEKIYYGLRDPDELKKWRSKYRHYAKSLSVKYSAKKAIKMLQDCIANKN